MRWTVATAWRPVSGSWRAYRDRARRAAVRTLDRRTHERAAGDSQRLTDTLRSELAGAGCELTALDGPGALCALARAVQPARPPAAEAFGGLARVLDTTDPRAALEHRHRLIRALAGDR